MLRVAASKRVSKTVVAKNAGIGIHTDSCSREILFPLSKLPVLAAWRGDQGDEVFSRGYAIMSQGGSLQDLVLPRWV